jgi:hypothetical protein
MKKLITFTALTISAVVVFGMVKNAGAKALLENGVRFATEFELEIDKIDVGIINQTITIKDLKLLNPKQFLERTMLDLPEIQIRYHLPAIIQGNIHLPLVKIHLKKFMVVKDQAGKSNIDTLKNLSASKEEGPRKDETSKKGLPFQIDVFELQIDRVGFRDYSKGPEPSSSEYNLNIHDTYRNIKSPTKLVMLIFGKALLGTTIGRFVDVDLGALEGTVSDAVAHSKKILSSSTEAAAAAWTGAKGKAGEALGRSTESFKTSTSGALETAQEKTAAIGEKTKSLVGGLKSKVSLPLSKKS